MQLPPPRYRTTIEPCACSCPDWQYRGRLRPCKHVSRLREAKNYVEAQTAVNAAFDLPEYRGADGELRTAREAHCGAATA